MPDPKPTPSFPLLLQRFFVEHLGSQRAVSPRTIAAYRDTFRLLLSFASGEFCERTRLVSANALWRRLECIGRCGHTPGTFSTWFWCK